METNSKDKSIADHLTKDFQEYQQDHC